jgi:twitching motility protein PilT
MADNLIDTLLADTLAKGSSDLHIATNEHPKVRVDGDLVDLTEQTLTREDVDGMLASIMNETQQKNFKEEWELDFFYSPTDSSGFRVNAYMDSQGPALAFRPIPGDIPSLEDLDLPDICKELCQMPNGIILVTGATGSGKSTTLASMVDYINKHERRHILTIEDPIEFYHHSKLSLVNQREVGSQTKSFNAALKSALREDPDTILIGEMRDIETIRLALTAAETGHLVFATLHTSSAAKTINRIIDVFPAGDKPMVRSMLAESMRAVIAQTLIKRASGKGRIAAREILVCTPAVRNMIRQDLVPQIESAMQTGKNYGMITMEQAIKDLLEKQLITSEDAAVELVLS